MDSKKFEEDGAYLHIEKSAVLQEARSVFNQSNLNVKKCEAVLSKLLYLLYLGESVSATEATETFFAVTKLFQSKNVIIRRLVYLAIKELAKVANDVIIVTSSLTKDMTAKEDLYRAAAIRALCRITDSTMLQGIERYMKQAIVDRNPSISSAALVSSLHLLKDNHEVVKRWVNEVQEVVNGKNSMSQYHALGLMYHIKQKDRLAVSKLVTSLIKSGVRSPLAHCNLIRYAVRSMEDEPSQQGELLSFLEMSLRNKSEIVVYEAARSICNLRSATPKELIPALSVLQVLLTAAKPVIRFAAVKTLNMVANKLPAAVAVTNVELENLIADPNLSIATLAITTLLKTGRETSVTRLMEQIKPFMTEISDEFKIVVIDAIRILCLKYPAKHVAMMNFLSSILRTDGSFDYKKAIVDTITSIIEEIPASREIALSNLCEFIEDCEYTSLSTRVLHMLGRLGPQSQFPARYIRFIYNRVALENSTVRSAAVSALAKFAASSQSENMLPTVSTLLQRCIYDTDDEVRDRAVFYIRVLNAKNSQAKSYIVGDLPFSMSALEHALVDYIKNPTSTPFTLKGIPLQAVKQKSDLSKMDQLTGAAATAATASHSSSSSASSVGGASAGASAANSNAAIQDAHMKRLNSIPEFSSLGPLFKSSQRVALTEKETEYVVTLIKHVYSAHVVLEYEVVNTLNDQLLEDVRVQLECPDGFVVEKTITAKKLPYGEPQSVFAAVSFPKDDPTTIAASFATTLKFTVRDCDPETGEPDEQGYPDEYLVEDSELVAADHIIPIEFPDYGAAWNALPAENELSETFELSTMKSLEDAVKSVMGFLGMAACNRSDRFQAGQSKNVHTLQLSGLFRNGDQVLVSAKLALKGMEGVVMQLTVRSASLATSEIISVVIS